MGIMRFVITACLLATVYTAPAHGMKSEHWRLAVGGKSQVTVVVPVEAGELVQAAAKDLSRCLGKAIEADVPLVNTPSEAKTPYLILLGSREGVDLSGLERDGCLLKTEGNRLLITGATEVGVSNGVYTFLTEYIGVRWFIPDPLYEVIPSRPGLLLPPLNYKRNPDFRYRMLVGVPGAAGKDWERRNRQDSDERGISRFGFGHNIHTILPPSRYGKTHPEYFAMIDGRRKVPQDGWDTTNPCFTHPDVIRIAAEAADRFFRENPERDTFSLSINDTADHCQCPRCAEMDAGLPPGQGGVRAFSESYFYFVSEVAKRVAKTNPGKYLGCFPYWPVYPLIRRIDRLPDNVVIQLTQDTSQQHDPQYRRQERAHWLNWSRKVASISKYDYYDLGWLTPRYFPHIAASDIQFIQANGCDGFYCAITPNWSILGPQIYMAARLLWDSRLNPDALLAEYCDTLFGPAGAQMKRFYATLERYWLQPRKARWFEGLAGITSEFTIINGRLIEEAWQCLERAERASSGIEQQRVKDVKAHFRLSYLLVKALADARELASRRMKKRADMDTLAEDILRTRRYLTEAKKVYESVWQPDPNYNTSYYSPENMRVRLRDWSYEQAKWLTIAANNARRFCRTLPPEERDKTWETFRQKLLAHHNTLDTQPLVRDYHTEFDRSNALLNKEKKHFDNTNGELAWRDSYQLMGYVEMYRATGDRAYLRLLVALADRIFRSRDDFLGRIDAYAGRPLAGWGSERYSGGKWHVWIVHTGMITIGPAQFVRLVREDQALQKEFGEKAAEYRARIEECIRDAEPYWRNGPEPDEGHYVGAHLGRLLPLNQQNAMGIVLLEMYKATGNRTNLDKVRRLARFFHRRLRYPHSDYYDWAYWPKEGDDGQGSEDISHASINMHFAARCAEEGIVFTRADIIRFARTWLQVVRRGDGTWADTVGGGGKGNRYIPSAAGRWLVLCPLLPEHLATRLYQDVARAFSEERPYKASEMLGIARLLRLAPSSRMEGHPMHASWCSYNAFAIP